MKNQKKKTLLCKALAAILCFAMMVSAIAPVTAQAASRVELALRYKGKTIVVEKLDADDMQLNFSTGFHQASYSKIKKAFGEPKKNKSYSQYEYKDSGFLFALRPWGEGSKGYGLSIQITSKKAALNGIMVGMSYDDVINSLEKNYGRSRIITQKDKKQIQLTYGPFMPITYTFKSGKVSKIWATHS